MSLTHTVTAPATAAAAVGTATAVMTAAVKMTAAQQERSWGQGPHAPAVPMLQLPPQEFQDHCVYI
jgi:hypothetical protein